jgi:hypothetical protein
MNSNSPSPSENWRPLALMLVGIAAVLVVVVRQIPYEYRLPNFAPAGALFLFVGARLRPGPWYLLPFALLAGIDLYFLGVNQWRPSPFVYASYAIYLGLGWLCMNRSESPLRIGLGTLAGSVQFFLITNFGVWLHHVMKPELYTSQTYQYPPNFAGLIDCYARAIPFFRGTLFSDALFAGAFFAAHAVLSRAYFPAERITPAMTTEPQT